MLIKWTVFVSFSLLLLLTLIVAQHTYAASYNKGDFTPQFEFYIDSTASQSIETIASLPDSAFEKAPKAGYIGGYNRFVHWLKFTLPPANNFDNTQAGDPLILRISPAYTDYLTLYSPNSSTNKNFFTATESGELIENWQKKTDRAFVFELATSHQPQIFYLRMESTNTNTLIARIYNNESYLHRLLFECLLSGGFIGLLLTLFFINVSNNKWRKNKNIRHYLFLIVVSLLVFLTGDGWMVLFFPNKWKFWAVYLPQISTLFYMIALAFFYHSLFGFNRHKKAILFWLSSSYLLLVVSGFMFLLLDYFVEYMPWFIIITITYLLWIAGVAFNWMLGQRNEGGLLLLAVMLGFSGILGTALSHNGLLSGGIPLLYSYIAGTFASILVFQRIMSQRIDLTEKQYVTMLLEKEYAEQLAERERADKEQKAQFISMLSHELKTPLSVISMGAAQSVLSDKARTYLQQAISDMSRVIDRCAVLEQVDSQVHTRCEVVELTGLISTLIQQTQLTKRVQWQPLEGVVFVHSDTDWLRVILSNLIDNALKYSPPDSVVSISLMKTKNHACIDVTNWTEDSLLDGQQIFAKYYRSKTAQKQTGSGLGLYIVKRLVDQLGAYIDYQPTYQPEMNQHQVVMHLCIPDLK